MVLRLAVVVVVESNDPPNEMEEYAASGVAVSAFQFDTTDKIVPWHATLVFYIYIYIK